MVRKLAFIAADRTFAVVLAAFSVLLPYLFVRNLFAERVAVAALVPMVIFIVQPLFGELMFEQLRLFRLGCAAYGAFVFCFTLFVKIDEDFAFADVLNIDTTYNSISKDV